MKLALIFLTVGVALVMGQNYYMQFSGSKNRHLPPYSDSGEMVANVYVPEEVQGRYLGYAPDEAPVRRNQFLRYGFPAYYGGGSGVGSGNVAYLDDAYEVAPRFFFNNFLEGLGVTTRTIYSYTTTATYLFYSNITSNCVSPSYIESLEATALPTLEGAGVERRARHLELASSQDNNNDDGDGGDGDDVGVGSVKYPARHFGGAPLRRRRHLAVLHRKFGSDGPADAGGRRRRLHLHAARFQHLLRTQQKKKKLVQTSPEPSWNTVASFPFWGIFWLFCFCYFSFLPLFAPIC